MAAEAGGLSALRSGSCKRSFPLVAADEGGALARGRFYNPEFVLGAFFLAGGFDIRETLTIGRPGKSFMEMASERRQAEDAIHSELAGIGRSGSLLGKVTGRSTEGQEGKENKGQSSARGWMKTHGCSLGSTISGLLQ
jgi:hypothetical protein